MCTQKVPNRLSAVCQPGIERISVKLYDKNSKPGVMRDSQQLGRASQLFLQESVNSGPAIPSLHILFWPLEELPALIDDKVRSSSAWCSTENMAALQPPQPIFPRGGVGAAVWMGVSHCRVLLEDPLKAFNPLLFLSVLSGRVDSAQWLTLLSYATFEHLVEECPGEFAFLLRVT